MPAHLRYSGSFYEAGAEAIVTALRAGCHVLIVSGGYGLLLAEECIGWYERRFSLADWPKALLESCLIDYARRERIRHAFAFMSRSGSYYKLVERTPWEQAGLSATLVSPQPVRGAYRKAPRAAGQGMLALVREGLAGEWTSSDGLRLDVREVGERLE